jgi:hypothetical protein
LPWLSGRGFRGLVSAGALAGLATFAMPWFALEHPNTVDLSGFDLARGNAPWLWGGAIGYFLILPLLFSRRSLNDLRRIRVITATFAIMTACEVLVIALKPPVEAAYFHSQLQHLPAFYVSAVVSVLTTVGSALLGWFPQTESKPSPTGPLPRTEDGNTLH